MSVCRRSQFNTFASVGHPVCAKQVLTEEGKKDALQHEAERAAADAKQEAVQARSNAQASCTPYAQEVGVRQNTESQIAHLQQKLQQVMPQKLLGVLLGLMHLSIY